MPAASSNPHERGRTAPSVLAQYESTVRPMYEQHAAPTRRYADILLDGEAPLEQSLARLLSGKSLAGLSEYPKFHS